MVSNLSRVELAFRVPQQRHALHLMQRMGGSDGEAGADELI